MAPVNIGDDGWLEGWHRGHSARGVGASARLRLARVPWPSGGTDVLLEVRKLAE